MGIENRTTRPLRTILSCWEIEGSVLRYLRADLNDSGLPVHSTHGSFESPVDLDVLLGGRPSGSSLPELELPVLYDDIILLVHPWLAPTFSTLVDPEWNGVRVSRHVEQEARIVLGDDDGGSLRYEYVGNDFVQNRRMDRILVTHVPDSTFEIGRLLAPSGFEVRSTLAVVADLIGQELKFGGNPESTVVGLGWYARKAELTVVQGGSLRLAGFVAFEDPVAGLSKIEMLMAIGRHAGQPLSRLLLYGHEVQESFLEASPLFSRTRVEWLRPNDLFEEHDRPVSRDSRFTAVAAGALAHLVSHV